MVIPQLSGKTTVVGRVLGRIKYSKPVSAVRRDVGSYKLFKKGKSQFIGERTIEHLVDFRNRAQKTLSPFQHELFRGKAAAEFDHNYADFSKKMPEAANQIRRGKNYIKGAKIGVGVVGAAGVVGFGKKYQVNTKELINRYGSVDSGKRLGDFPDTVRSKSRKRSPLKTGLMAGSPFLAAAISQRQMFPQMAVLDTVLGVSSAVIMAHGTAERNKKIDKLRRKEGIKSPYKYEFGMRANAVKKSWVVRKRKYGKSGVRNAT